MNKKILVAYVSVHGATQQAAEAIADTLRGCGCEVDLLPAGKVRSLDEYAGVTLGAPLYMFHLHQKGLGFIRRFQKELQAGLPIAVFSGGPFNDKEEEWEAARSMLAKDLAKFPWLQPASTLVVGGKFDPAHLRFPYNLIPAMKSIPASDTRNWDAVSAWAKSLADVFAVARV